MSQHRIAVRDFDGNMEVVEADELRACMPTAACLKFWATIASCLVAMGLAVFLMIWGGPNSDLLKAGTALLGLATGVLIPGPEYDKVLQKKRKILRRRRRPARRTRSAPPVVASPASKSAGEHTAPLQEVRCE